MKLSLGFCINMAAFVLAVRACLPGVDEANCFVDPCQFATCPREPGAKCQSDVCGGCHAIFSLGGRRLSPDQCAPPPCPTTVCQAPPRECPPGSHHGNLNWDKICGGQACCGSGDCGGCVSDADDTKYADVLSCVNTLCESLVCPIGQTPRLVQRALPTGPCCDEFECVPEVVCMMPMCLPLPTSCPLGSHPGNVNWEKICGGKPCCGSADCGGCVSDKDDTKYVDVPAPTGKPVPVPKRVRNPTKGRACPPGVDEVNCFVDPCAVAKCPGVPSAVCRANYCGGCNAEFYHANINVLAPLTKEQCTARACEPFTQRATTCRSMLPLGFGVNAEGHCVPVFGCSRDVGGKLFARLFQCRAYAKKNCK